MSRRRQKKHEPAGRDRVEAAVRQSLGHSKYAYPKYRPARRLRCDKCRKTWKFSDTLNFAPCPACKQGRLS